ncbi:MAG: class I SAM-dependent methyltransferase [Thermodesulfovibrionales bacterium]|jgi:2-polyprenyl-6-hydroxyphenyl methylase/3-demethylubiquinone-9 3-methyltransferase
MKTSRDEKMLFYDRFADQFDTKMNMYDTNRRLKVVFDELLTEDIKEKALLDAGSGTGWFSREAALRGARVVSLDVGENILAQVAKKCDTQRIVGSVLDIPFEKEYFDVVLSTEVIEHTPDPKKAIHEMHRVLRREGVLILTVPNKIWHPAITVANMLKLRPYEGYENWVGWIELKRWLNEAGFSIGKMKGLHVIPFIFPFSYKFLSYMDRFGEAIGPIMLNICVRAVKK